MYLTKWDPFESLSTLQSEIDDLFGRHLSPLFGRKGGRAESEWWPAVDIHEDNEAYYFDIEAPGMEKDQFHVNIEDTVLTIKGERKKEVEKKEKNYFRVEREYGEFCRSFRLPDTADPSKIRAEYKQGVLQVSIAKKEAVKPKEIPVKIAA